MKQHSPQFLALVNAAKRTISEISPEALKAMLDAHQPLTLIDVRDEHELTSGCIPGAIHVSKGVIERDIEKLIPDFDTPIVVYCSGGFRCALVAYNLQKMGYTHVFSLNSGLQGWLDCGYMITRLT